VEGHTHAIRKRDAARPKRNNALWVAEQLGMRLHIVDIVDEYKDVVLNPRHGYGANLNPCLDCKVFMVHKALDWARERGFDFLVTGEVVGQRPKSQRKDTMPVVARESGAGDLLLRPLCARNLPPSLPEREGWVEREALFDFSGRSRKPQMALARKLGIEDYAQPAGGCCFLTDPNYAVRVFDLFEHERKARIERDDLLLCKVGRHFRVGPHSKVVVGRFEEENAFLANFSGRRPRLEAVGHQGPLVVIDGVVDEEVILAAARLTARYCDGKGEARVIVSYREDDGERRFEVAPYAPDECEAWLLR
jgi:tRNA U34 2-thiouridine synthase MnmA/TrmU